MNLRNGKLKNSAQPIPKRRYNRKMAVTASAGGDQDPPQVSGSEAANSTSSQGTQNTTGPNGSRPADNSQTTPENTTSGMSHLDHLSQSFERMRKYGLKMNPLKCAFF